MNIAEWKNKYKQRLVAKGLKKKDAEALCLTLVNSEIDLAEDPSDMADDELSYWTADS